MKGEFDIGKAFSDTFGIWAKNLPAFIGITAMVVVPILVLIGFLVVTFGIDMDPILDPQAAQPPFGATPEELNDFLERFGIATMIFAGGIGLALQIVTVIGVLAAAKAFRGEPWTIGSLMGPFLRHLPASLVTAFLVGIGITAGMVLCCLPGIFLALVWHIVIPTLVLERTGIFGAMKRSLQLSLPNFWYVLLLALAVFAINMAVGMVVSVFGMISPIIQNLLSLLTNLFLMSLTPVSQTVLFFHLREALEGPEKSQLEEVFE